MVWIFHNNKRVNLDRLDTIEYSDKQGMIKFMSSESCAIFDFNADEDDAGRVSYKEYKARIDAHLSLYELR